MKNEQVYQIFVFKIEKFQYIFDQFVIFFNDLNFVVMDRNKFAKLENISAYDFYSFYLKNSRLFGLIWFLLTICFTISIIIVFLSPDWIGDSIDSPNRGFFGLHSFCTLNIISNEYECFGTWTDFSTLPNSAAIKAACVLVGLTCLFSLLSLIISLFCLLVKYERIFHICAWIQFICRKKVHFKL